MKQVNEQEKRIFEELSVGRALFQLAFPTVIGQIILVIYNMADTFFVGLTRNDAMLAAVTVCMPAFMFLSAISNLFGVGGASVISRALGAGDSKLVRRASSFALFGCMAVTALYSLAAFLLKHPFLNLLGGTNPEVHKNAAAYLFCTVIAGGMVTSVSVLFSHLLRSEGHSIYASTGVALGGLMNILLDPLFMFVILPKGNEALGAAIATALSNAISLVYFLIVLRHLKGRTELSFRFDASMLKSPVPYGILIAGLPACVMTLFENISYAVLDKLMSLSGLPMQAGIGVAKKVNMLAHCIVRGIAQGSLPLIGYNFASGNRTRMRSSLRMAHRAAVVTATLCMAICLIFAPALIGIFIHGHTLSRAYGITFLRILCIGGPFSASAYTYISFFQATGEGIRSLFLALLRKGILDIPLMFVLSVILPVYGIVAATPIADALCCAAANILFLVYIRNLMAGRAGTKGHAHS